MRQARHELRRDPGYIVPTMTRCLTALERGHPQDALVALRRYMDAMGEVVLSLRRTRSRAAS
jgi:hypothetical protein